MSEAAKDRTALVSAGPPQPQPIAFTPQLRAQTGPRSGWSGRLREASAERTLVVDRPVEDVLPHLWKIKNVEFCERKADEVIVYCFNHAAEIWWRGIENKLTRPQNLSVFRVPAAISHSLAGLAQRSMQLQATIQEGVLMLGDGARSIDIEPVRFK